MFLDLDRKPENKTALIDSDGKHVTYGELAAFADTFGKAIGPRSLIFIRCRNCAGAVAGFLASVSNHIVPLLLGDSMDETLFDQLVEIYHPSYMWKPESERKSDEDVRFSGYGYVLEKTEYDPYPMHDELSLLLSTSGSTGSPKLVRHSYDNLDSQCRNISSFFGINEGDRAMADLPMNYTMGLSVIMSFLYAGATVLLTGLNVLDPEYWAFFKENKATVLTNIPYTFEILEKLHFFKMDLPSLRILSQGGGKLREDLFRRCAEYAENNGIQFIATYGQTEGTARMAYLAPEYASTKICSIGKAIPGGQIYLIDEKGGRIDEADKEGEMIYEGPNVTLGYAQCANDLLLGDERKGVLHTGDLAKTDEDGFFYIVGRISRFLKLTGHRVGLDECEKMLMSKYGIECACTGDDTMLRAYISDDNVNPDSIRDYLAEMTSINASMISVYIVKEIPRNSSGKILYSHLQYSEINEG